MKTKLSVLFLILASVANTFGQTKTNLEIINALISQSVAHADSILGGKQTINLKVETPSALEVLKPKIFEAFIAKGYSIKTGTDLSEKSVDYTLFTVKTEYENSYSDGIFGGTMVERNVMLDASLIIKSGDKPIMPVQFHKEYLDTVNLNNIHAVENQVLPFTHAELPSLPLLSNLWEPIIVVGTLTVTVILLFTVRSK